VAKTRPVVENFAYLAIKNWDKHQKLQSDKPAIYIQDYTDKDGHPDYSQLTFLQRYVLDGCQRLRGRFGCNLPNDVLWVGRALAALPQERHNLSAALRELVGRGFLIPCNEKISLQSRVEKSREDQSINSGQSSDNQNGESPNTDTPAVSRPKSSSNNPGTLPEGMRIVDEMFLVYPMKPRSEAIRKKWKDAILLEIGNGVSPAEILDGVDRFSRWDAEQTFHKVWTLDKFVRDGHYQESWEIADRPRQEAPAEPSGFAILCEGKGFGMCRGIVVLNYDDTPLCRSCAEAKIGAKEVADSLAEFAVDIYGGAVSDTDGLD
jgi:hypothetical protein